MDVKRIDADHRARLADLSGARLAGRLELAVPAHRPADLARQYKNYKRSAAPSKFFHFSDGSWLEFGRHVFDELLHGFRSGRTTIEAAVAGVWYLFDFVRMLQIQLDSGAANSVAWIDAEGQFFFPRSAVDARHDSAQRLEIEIRVKDGALDAAVCSSGIRAESVLLPPEESAESPDVPRPEAEAEAEAEAAWVGVSGVSELDCGDKYYRIIEKLFLGEMERAVAGVQIVGIRKCLHSGSHAASRLKAFNYQIQMVKAARGYPKVRIGWYAASAAELGTVVEHGIGQPNSRLLGEDAFGVGVHLSAPQFPYASSLLQESDSRGEKHLVLCRVITGNCEQIEMGSRQAHPSSDEFDSGVDCLEHPKWYIVWSTYMNTHIIPECIVSYKCSKQSQSQGSLDMVSKVRRPAPSMLSFSKLVSELGRALPSSMIQSVQISYNQFREGKIGKDIFIRSLRTLVGDKLLSSSIRKMRGC